jgi:hypothetical protein
MIVASLGADQPRAHRHRLSYALSLCIIYRELQYLDYSMAHPLSRKGNIAPCYMRRDISF